MAAGREDEAAPTTGNGGSAASGKRGSIITLFETGSLSKMSFFSFLKPFLLLKKAPKAKLERRWLIY